MGKKSSEKGARFERKIAKAFADAYGFEIVRTPQSGGWGRFQTKGDLVAPGHEGEFPWFIECKCEEKWNLWSTIFDDTGPVSGWWKKACEQADSEGKEPLLVVGQRQQQPVVFIHAVTVATRINIAEYRYIVMQIEEQTVIGLRLDAFLHPADHGWPTGL